MRKITVEGPVEQEGDGTQGEREVQPEVLRRDRCVRREREELNGVAGALGGGGQLAVTIVPELEV